MGFRRLGQRWLALLVTLFFVAAAAPAPSAQADVLGNGAHAIAKKKRKKRTKKKKKVSKAAAEEKAPEKAAEPEPAPVVAEPAANPAPIDAAAPADAPAAELAPVVTPNVAPPALAPFEAAPQTFEPNAEPLWGGFFLSLNVGYATSGGKAGPIIPPVEHDGIPIIDLNPTSNPSAYAKAVTTDGGAGLAAAFQVGYNIVGYVSFWGDFSWHGSFGSKTDTAGAGTVALMLGLHPLQFWRPDSPVDMKLYCGYGVFEILYYYETQLDSLRKPKGKSWLGTAIPFGLSFEYRIPGSVFALGADLRFVAAAYDEWIYNYKNEKKSVLTTPETTFRFEPRLIMGWHF